MEIQDELLEPLKLYQYELSYKHQDNIDEYFKNLTEQSGVDIESNEQTCKEYYNLLKEIDDNRGKLNGQRGLRGFLIFLIIFSFIVGTILIILSAAGILPYPAIGYSVGPFLILLGIGLIVINSIVIAKKISSLSSKVDVLNKKANEKLAIAKEQMAALNALFDWNVPSKLVTKTTPIIQMDDYFKVERHYHMVENYGMKPYNNDNVSTIFVQSGTLVGNPFVYERDYVQVMYQQTYTGSITISWVTYARDSKGRTYPVTHTQTLTATISKPAARFYTDTALIYACEAAPNLTFSRTKSNANSMSEKDLDKFERNWDKKLKKMQEDNIKGTFTPLGNSKFEGLFNALNRNNEVEFRLLFTPLAQKNMINLIMSKKPYGDDFAFTKRKMINVIHSDHAQTLKFDGNPYNFLGFDYQKMKENFTNYNMRYFQGIYYDFAPLLSIPLYQQTRDFDYEYKGHCPSNYTAYEAEVLCNYMDEDVFKPEKCDTSVILKATFIAKQGPVDIFNIHSYGFEKVPRVEYVTKMGGDGHLHTIPVHWFEYILVEKDTPIAMLYVGGSRPSFNQNFSAVKELLSTCALSDDIIYQRGLLAFALGDNTLSLDSNALIKITSHKEE